MKVTLIGRTAFNSDIAYDLTDGWEGDAKDTDGALLVEFAGRACYQSWTKPNPVTATNEGYIAHLIEVAHKSVLEHGTLSFYIEEVSRSLTHEFVRHRHLSPSQESQRYVKLGPDVKFVIPPLYEETWGKEGYEGNPVSRTQGILEEVWSTAIAAYDELVKIWEDRLLRMSGLSRMDTQMKKKAREAARCVLPNMTPTRIVMTGNHSAWRHFLDMRGSLHADVEIRRLALEIHRWANNVEPALYQDYIVKVHDKEGPYLERRVS